jgi:hypothetical protein
MIFDDTLQIRPGLFPHPREKALFLRQQPSTFTRILFLFSSFLFFSFSARAELTRLSPERPAEDGGHEGQEGGTSVRDEG